MHQVRGISGCRAALPRAVKFVWNEKPAVLKTEEAKPGDLLVIVFAHVVVVLVHVIVVLMRVVLAPADEGQRSEGRQGEQDIFFGLS